MTNNLLTEKIHILNVRRISVNSDHIFLFPNSGNIRILLHNSQSQESKFKFRIFVFWYRIISNMQYLHMLTTKRRYEIHFSYRSIAKNLAYEQTNVININLVQKCCYLVSFFHFFLICTRKFEDVCEERCLLRFLHSFL